jgi:hypothetical protein
MYLLHDVGSGPTWILHMVLIYTTTNWFLLQLLLVLFHPLPLYHH